MSKQDSVKNLAEDIVETMRLLAAAQKDLAIAHKRIFESHRLHEARITELVERVALLESFVG